MNIHLHNNRRNGQLKDEVNDFKSQVIGSLLPSQFFDHEDEPSTPKVPSKEELHPDIHKLLTNRDIEEMLEPVDHVSWSCTAEKNYYWTFGG
tara:strand:- start:47 stop:322 length:276 start_codon:yes stop_codon:yes gene_type:complete